MVPLDVEHHVVLRRNSVLLVLLDYDGGHSLLLQRLRVSLAVALLFFLVGFLQLFQLVAALRRGELLFARLSVGILEVALVLILVDVGNGEDLVGVGSSRPDAHVPITHRVAKYLFWSLVRVIIWMIFSS